MGKIYSIGFNVDIINFLADLLLKGNAPAGTNLCSVAIVTPGKRPQIYLRRALAKRIGKAFPAPGSFSIEEFIQYLAKRITQLSQVGINRQPVSLIDACFLIHKIIQQLNLTYLDWQKQLEFEHFFLWARKIFQFLEELDRELISEQQLLNLQENAQIGLPLPDYINQLLENINQIHKEFHRSLKQNNLTTPGLNYYQVAQSIDKICLDEFKKIYFVGFFALNNCEKIIIKHLLNQDKACLIWQQDEDTWSILQELEDFFAIRPERIKSKNSRPKVEIYEAFDTHSQIEGARQVLSSLDDLEDTCVVLPQASCLMPLLYQAIPADLSNYNISLGYPLKHTPIYALIDMIMQAQERKRQDNSFYTKDYLKVIMHPYIKNIGDEGFSRDVMRMMIHKIEEALLGIDKTIGIAKKPFIRLPEIEENSLIFQAAAGLISKSGIAAIQPKDLRSQLRLVHQKIFSAFDNCTRLIDFVKSTQEVLYFILAKSKAGLDIFSSEVFGRFLDTLDSLGYSLCKDEPIKNKATFFELLKIYLSSENIPFAGTPLRGLQILGLLETRNLKFSNLLILDLNEGILPKTDKGESFIPEGIFPLLGLTHYHKREQIMRYHFRRLIGSAKNASLFFKTCSHNNQSRSRFIEEIIWQEEKSSQRLYDQKKIKRIEFKIKPTKESFRLKKTPQTLKLIREIVFSPTSLDTYLNCPARFYFHYCLGLTEKEDIFDELEASDIGNFLHSLLEDFYSLFLNKTVKIDERAQQYLFQLKENKYKQFFPSDTAEQFLLSKIIDYKLKAFLNQEAKRKEKIKILCLEQILPVDSQKISINTEYGRVCLRGKLDRVDERILGGRRRIVILDYKTGKYNLPKRITHKMSLTSRQEIKRGIVSFQLPLYIYLFSQAKRISPHSGIEASFYSLRDIKEEFLFGDKDAGNLFAIYLDAAKRIFSEILCPNFDILRDDTDEQYCRWCPFPALCKR